MNSIKETVNFPEPTMIPINGIELEVFEAGKENLGSPIVLCHGFPEHAYSWRYQIPALANAGYHVIVPNQRGYGNSSRPKEVTAYDITHLTDDLVALQDWYKKANKAEWDSFADLKNTFNSADSVGNGRFVFNIKGNHYRVVAIVRFKFKKVLIRWVGNHRDYYKIKNIDKL